MNKTVLMIAYYFPPLGMGGVQRMAKLAKYLPRLGYDVDVLTVKQIQYPAEDNSLLDELPNRARIHRSGSSDPARISKFIPLPAKANDRMKTMAKDHSSRFWPDSKIGWKRPAFRLARKIAEDSKPGVILSSSPPITSHLVAMDLKSITGIPWVADFRDPWESRPAEQIYSNQALVEKSRLLLREIIESADAVTSINDSISRDLTTSAFTIMGGYDSEDFEFSAKPDPDPLFTMCYMGTVGPLHPIEPFIEAARIASDIDPDFAPLVRIKVIGANDHRHLEKTADTFELKDKLQIVDYLPHREALLQASTAAVSLISVPREHPGILTGKIFDYLPLDAPVLASVPAEGEIEQVIKGCRGGVCVEPGQARALAEAMLHLFKNHQNGIPWQKGDISHFTRESVARHFAEIFDRVAGD